MKKFDLNGVLTGYYLYFGIPVSLSILFYELMLTEESNIGWRDYFEINKFGEHMYHMSRNHDYYIPPYDTSEIIMCPTLAFIHHSKYPVDPETGMYSYLHSDEESGEPVEELEWSVAEFIPRSIPCWATFRPENLPEEEDFVMSYANLKEMLQDEVFEVAEKECYVDDEDYGMSEYHLIRKTFGEMMASDLQREITQTISEASIMDKLMQPSSKQRVQAYFSTHFVSEIADVQDVTIWATVPGLDEDCDESLVMSPERSQQSQYTCVAEGKMRYYLVSVYQSLFMTPRQQDMVQDWESKHVSRQDLRDFIDEDARVYDNSPLDILTIDVGEGQCIFIPAGWWYQIEADTNDRALTVTHWYDIGSTWIELIFNGIGQNIL